MINRVYLFIVACLWCSTEICAQFVSLEAARCVAKNFFALSTASSKMTELPLGKRDQPSMYAFSLPNQWVLIAADRRVQPILAYSDENGGTFPIVENMPDGMLYLLDWYHNQIEVLRNDSTYRDYNTQWETYLHADNEFIPSRSVVVGPLLSRGGYENMWEQHGNSIGGSIEKSYNKFCPPAFNFHTMQICDHSVVGCVALAASQIMWYWQWPYAAVINGTNGNHILRHYDWNLMPYRLTDASSIEEANMVANLLHDVGMEVNMNYGCEGSYAATSDMITALQNTFFYSTDNLIQRSNYLNVLWILMLKTELNESRPVIYGGKKVSSGTTGHQFVIDGYTSDNKFHVNIGAGSPVNFYCSLDTISGGYNYDQSMVKNIHPNYPTCSPVTNPAHFILFTSTSFINELVLQQGGTITLENRTITSGKSMIALSGESIVLAEGLTIQNGAYAHIAIKDMHCNADLISPSQIPAYEPMSEIKRVEQSELSPYNQPQKLLQNNQILIIRGEHTYTITGQLVQ